MVGLLSAPPPAVHRPRSRCVVRLAAVLGLLVCGGLLTPDALSPFAPAFAQELAFPPTPPAPPKSPAAIQRAAGKQMLVQAREINYDYNNNKVSAVGNVQIYYGGNTIEADRVIYDLGLVRELGYYTGAVFEVYDAALGAPIGGGGRYDDLLGRFGAPRPACGVALDIHRVHMAQLEEERQS